MIWPLSFLIFAPMLVEARRAARNARTQIARGAIEPHGDVYALMKWAYPGLFAIMLVEGTLRGTPGPRWIVSGVVCFLAGKIVKWWAIVTLGPFWTFRVLVLPGVALVRRGPYRFLRHPNYLGVVLEFVGAALMLRAAVSGPLAVVLFGVLLKRRIAVENRALGSSSRHPPCSL